MNAQTDDQIDDQTDNFVSFLSFDCAIKTLGYVYAVIDKSYLHNFYEILKTDDDIVRNKLLLVFSKQKHVDIINCGVKDILVDLDNEKVVVKSVPYVQRFDKLYKFLETLKVPDCVLLEDQWNINSQSNSVASGIIMYYLSKSIKPENIITINPNKKNKIAMNPSLTFEKIKEMFPTNTKYMRMKRIKYHTIKNTEFYISLHKFEHLFTSIKKNKMEHVSDAFMQLYYYAICNVR